MQAVAATRRQAHTETTRKSIIYPESRWINQYILFTWLTIKMTCCTCCLFKKLWIYGTNTCSSSNLFLYGTITAKILSSWPLPVHVQKTTQKIISLQSINNSIAKKTNHFGKVKKDRKTLELHTLLWTFLLSLIMFAGLTWF